MARTGWQKTWVRVLTTLLTLAVMAAVFGFSTETAEESDRRSGAISLAILGIICPDYEALEPEAQKEAYDGVQWAVRKCAHFTEYLILGFLLRLCLESWFGNRTGNRRILPAAASGLGAGYACTDEFHQLSVDGRSGQWTDVLVDGGGVLAGVTLACLLIRLLAAKKDPR